MKIASSLSCFSGSDKFKKFKRQAGMTLIEMITSLAILALVIGGALALYNSASTSQSSTQFNSDMNAIRSAVRSTYFGQGGYGIIGLNPVLIAGKRVPATMGTSGAVINHSLGGTVTVTGATGAFTVALTNIPTAVCMNLMTAATGWNSVAVTGAAAPQTSFPVSPANAATDCAAGTVLTFNGS